MAAKILKYAAVPAAGAVVGLGSIRIYTMSENNSEELISPRELSIYSPDRPAVQFVKEQPGLLQTGLGVVRVGLQPYVRAVQSGFYSVKLGVISVYQAGEDTYHFLRDPPPGFLSRVSVITVSGLGGLILARKGSRLKRIVVPLGLATIGTAVCYPTQTVGVLKITGKRVYTLSSSIASVFKSKPKEDIIMPAVSVESAVPVTKALPELIPESELAPAVLIEEVTSISEVAPAAASAPVADFVSEVTSNESASVPEVAELPSVVEVASEMVSASEPETTPDTEIATTDITPEPALETVSVVEPTPEPVAEAAPTAGITPELALKTALATKSSLEPIAETVPTADITPEPALETASATETTLESVFETDPNADITHEPALQTASVAETTPEQAAEITPESATESVVEAALAAVITSEPPLPEPVVETAPEAIPADFIVDNALQSTHEPTIFAETVLEADVSPVMEAAPASPELEVPAPTIEDPTPPTVYEEPVSITLPPVEEAILLEPPPTVVKQSTAEEVPIPVQEATPHAPTVKEPPVEQTVVEPAKVKTHFVPNPALLDHGQANPEDADMYSTRS
ncbi:MICOS complex subunit MIC27 isoform X1 [Xyrauchen texanus]|uniref:MICOS complex subunit MIC27 isoform X1 n=1 Tax=Xyrauchen texanus TaxID=154827 RepID=UPI002241CE1A|nr:MICOS complex subunit MIC27 isoform X1 [Xyrauchen texanus]